MFYTLFLPLVLKVLESGHVHLAGLSTLAWVEKHYQLLLEILLPVYLTNLNHSLSLQVSCQTLGDPFKI